MKRPLCLFAVVFALVHLLIQLFTASPRIGAAFEKFPEKGTLLYMTGRLYKKEIKNDRLIYYLKEVCILEPIKESSQITYRNQRNSSNNFFNNVLYSRQEMGAVCYIQDTGQMLQQHPVGSRVYVQGTFLPFESAQNDGQFDAAEYYADLGYHFRLWNGKVLGCSESGDSIGEMSVDIKEYAAHKFQGNMSLENAGILSAMLLGDKTSMEPEIKNLYKKSGISHVLAISGLHISLIGMLIYRLLRRVYLPPPLCSVGGMILVLVYIKLTGFGISSFRAVCMFLLYMLADLLGRSYDLRTALAFSAMLLIADDPKVMYQAGFLLSYAAVLALGVVDPVLQADARMRAEFKRQQRRRRGHPAKEFILKIFISIRIGLMSGFSIQVFLFPITLWFYYEFPLCSFVLNLIVVPCMSAVLVCGIVGLLPVPGCSIALHFADMILSFYEWLCRMTGHVPGAVLVTGRPEIWQMVTYYVLIAVWLAREKKCSRPAFLYKRMMFIRFPRFVFPMLCMLLFLLPVHRENRIDMLSVGQGDCFCLRDATGKVVLVDGGSSDVSEVAKYRLVPFLKYHGISEIDVAFLSHAHVDHYSAIMELLESGGQEGVRIKTVCITDISLAGEDRKEALLVFEKIASLAQKSGCKVIRLSAGEKVNCGNMEFQMIYPDEGSSKSDENDCSMVLLARVGEVFALFTGDASSSCDEEVIRRLCALGVEKIHCLKVAHHGAKTSTGSELLDAFDFDVALISCGTDNSYGHPHQELLDRLRSAGCAVFTTPESGQVTLEIGDTIRVRERNR